MLRYIVFDMEENYAYEMVTNQFKRVGEFLTDPTDGHLCKVLRVEGGAFNGRKGIER